MVEPPIRRKEIRGPLLRFARGRAMMPITLMVVLFLFNLKDSTASDTPHDLDYCAHDNSVRKIPSLADSLKDFNPSLSVEDDVNMLQVQVFIRHGARTPEGSLSDGLDVNNCWANYNETWNCNATTLTQPALEKNNESVSNYKQHTIVFDKVYGDHGIGTETILKGTCGYGQLLDEGFKQQIKNGEILRDAYVCKGGGCLLNSNKIEDLEDISQDLWLTSDDMPRTIMSGQVLTSSFFNATKDKVEVEEGSFNIIEWRTGDVQIDRTFDFGGSCPRVSELEDDWSNSSKFKDSMGSEKAKILKDVLINDWGVPKETLKDSLGSFAEAKRRWYFVHDCVLTSICTERELPSKLLLETVSQLIDVAMWVNDYLFYESGAIPKIYFAPLFKRLREFALNSTTIGQRAPKFVLFSLHDSTIMALLSVLALDAWDRTWPPYASMIVIETMRIETKEYFRLIYNGKVLKLAGCEKDICSMDVLNSTTSFVTDLKVSSRVVVKGRQNK